MVLTFCFLSTVNLWKIYKAVESLGGYDSVSISLILSRMGNYYLIAYKFGWGKAIFLIIHQDKFANAICNLHRSSRLCINSCLCFWKKSPGQLYLQTQALCGAGTSLCGKKCLWLVKCTHSNVVTTVRAGCPFLNVSVCQGRLQRLSTLSNLVLFI